MAGSEWSRAWWGPAPATALVVVLLLRVGRTAAAPPPPGGGEVAGYRWEGAVTAVHWAPRIFHYEGFLTEAECDHLLKVGGAAGGDGGGEPARVQVDRGADSLVTLLERRIATVAFQPVANSRGFVVTHFEAGQRPADGAEGPGFVQAASVDDRMEAVVTLFLQAAEEGGETVFPKVNAPGPGESPAASSASCAPTGLALKPKRGDALLVYSVDLDNGIEPGAYQIDCPVINGAKSVATKAIYRAPADEL